MFWVPVRPQELLQYGATSPRWYRYFGLNIYIFIHTSFLCMCCPILLSPFTFGLQRRRRRLLGHLLRFFVRQQARDKNMGIAAIREQQRLEEERKKKQYEADTIERKKREANYRAWQARKEAEEKGETWPPPTPTPTSTPTPAAREEDPLCGFICLVILLAIFGYFLYGYGFHDSCDTWGEFLGICGLLWLLPGSSDSLMLCVYRRSCSMWLYRGMICTLFFDLICGVPGLLFTTQAWRST